MTDERDPGQPSDPTPYSPEPPASPQPPYAPQPASGAYAPPSGTGYGSPTPGGYDPAAPAGVGSTPPGAYGYAPEPPRRGGKGLAIAALIVGIAAFLGAFIPFVNYVVFVPAIAAIILGIIALVRRADGKPLAVTGLILGALGLVLSIALAVVYTIGIAAAFSDAAESSASEVPSADPEPSGDLEDPSSQPGTSPDDPLAIGTPVTGLGVDAPEWEVTLGTPILDGTAAVLAVDPSNPAPSDGMQYAIIPVTAKYLGTETGDPLSELAVGFQAADGTTYSAADAFAVAPAPALSETEAMLDPQGSVSGNVVVEIPIDGAEDGLWVTVPGTLADPYYFTTE